jgi:hypothetical protein
MLRRTAKRLSDRPEPIMDAAKAPSADGVQGFFFMPLDGGMAALRIIDVKWMLNRAVDLGRDGYIAAWCLYPFLWAMWWYVPQKAMWGDNAIPRKVDWNAAQTGKLPAGFEMTA